jgi:hypothetical protein
MTTPNLARNAQLSTFSNLAYSDSLPSDFNGWLKVDGVAPNTANGFFAVAYINPTTNEVVIAYRGTDGLKGYLNADSTFITGSWHPQFLDAAKFTNDVKQAVITVFKIQNLTFKITGHFICSAIAQVMGKKCSSLLRAFSSMKKLWHCAPTIRVNGKTMKTKKLSKAKSLALTWSAVAIAALYIPTVNAQTADTQKQETPNLTWSRESPPRDDSYTAIHVTNRQVHDIDPNIWAYSAAFADRFKMPKEWIAPDLQGAEAVAFRMEPAYKTCGWGGNPNACREDEMWCVMDVYFDNVKQPLPWDDKVRVTDLDVMATSAQFLPRPISRPRGYIGRRSPFSEPGTGNELQWSVEFQGLVGGGAYVAAYDKSIFESLSILKLSTNSCSELIRMQLEPNVTNNTKNKGYSTVIFPVSWRERTKEFIQVVNAKNEAHFKKIFVEMKKPSNSFN